MCGWWADTIGEGEVGENEGEDVGKGTACVEQKVELREVDEGEEGGCEGSEAFGESIADREEREDCEGAEG